MASLHQKKFCASRKTRNYKTVCWEAKPRKPIRRNLMPLFQYKALQLDGAIAEGQLEAAGRHEAFRQMETRGLKPISLAEKAKGTSENNSGLPVSVGSFSLKLGAKKISARILENF